MQERSQKCVGRTLLSDNCCQHHGTPESQFQSLSRMLKSGGFVSGRAFRHAASDTERVRLQALRRGVESVQIRGKESLPAPLIQHRKLIPCIRRKQLRHFPQPLRQRRRRQQRIIPLPQIVVIHV